MLQLRYPKSGGLVCGPVNRGRVTDDLDRRCLMSILKKYYVANILSDDYKLTPSGLYYAPAEGTLQSFRDHINDYPLTEAPEAGPYTRCLFPATLVSFPAQL